MRRRKISRLSRALRLLVLTLFIAVVCLHPISHLRAASLLVRFAEPDATGTIATFAKHPIDVEDLALDAAAGYGPARIYRPRDLPNAPGLVIVHGMHRLGIEEPRLQRLSRVIAETGAIVLTPSVIELSTYAVDPRSIDTIGKAVLALRARTGHKVGLVGTSFAGGLSLLAAADPRYADAVGAVLTVGAHDDLGRVLRFFLTNEIDRPDGAKEHLGAHGYGALVLARANADDLFAEADREGAREALRLWLADDPVAAKARTETLTPAARERLAALFDHHYEGVAPMLLAALARDEARLAAVSPHGRMASLRAPVFLLHGAGDTVIPPTETMWLAEDVPHSLLEGALVSNALVHVELDATTTVRDRASLVHLMAGLLTIADDFPP
jgi:pimeloyl-ACP methyl ester carboxylesterase